LTTMFDDLSKPGNLVNDGTMLIQGVDGSIKLGSPAPNDEVLYTFEYLVFVCNRIWRRGR